MNALILNREFQHPADGWYMIEPKGEHRNREAGVVQVIDDEAIASIVNRFNADADAGRLSHGNEMLIDHEHFKHDLDKETRAYGWLNRLQARADGTYGRIRWSGTGQKAVDEGDYRFFSTEYDPADVVILNGEGKLKRVRPTRLDGLTLTNNPNNKGGKPITNRDDGDGDGHWVTINGDHVFIKDGQTAEQAISDVHHRRLSKMAHVASEDADSVGHRASTKAQHLEAAKAHRWASELHAKLGNSRGVARHDDKAMYHEARARMLKNREDFGRGPGGSSADSETNNKRKSMKSVATKLGLSADASEEAVLAEVSKIINRATTAEGQVTPLQQRVSALETENATLVSEQIDADFAAAGIKDEKIINRHKPLLSDPKHFKNRAERVEFIKDLAPQGQKDQKDARDQKRLFNRDTKPPGQSAAGDNGQAERAKATKIMNRAAELQKQLPGMTLASAVTMAQNEENGS